MIFYHTCGFMTAYCTRALSPPPSFLSPTISVLHGIFCSIMYTFKKVRNLGNIDTPMPSKTVAIVRAPFLLVTCKIKEIFLYTFSRLFFLYIRRHTPRR